MAFTTLSFLATERATTYAPLLMDIGASASCIAAGIFAIALLHLPSSIGALFISAGGVNCFFTLPAGVALNACMEEDNKGPDLTDQIQYKPDK